MAVYLMGIDIGTSSCKTALFRPDGTVAASGGSEYPVSYPRRGWAEQDPREWWDGVCRAIRQMIEDYRVEGVIYHVLRGCLVYDYEYRAMEEELGKLGIPVIRVESDYNEEDVEQLRIRIEAFVELIKYGKR